jgi:hypothetical protein
VQVDDSLLWDIDSACAKIIQLEEKEQDNSRVEFLMTLQGGPIFLPWQGMCKTYFYISWSEERKYININTPHSTH